MADEAGLVMEGKMGEDEAKRYIDVNGRRIDMKKMREEVLAIGLEISSASIEEYDAAVRRAQDGGTPFGAFFASRLVYAAQKIFEVKLLQEDLEVVLRSRKKDFQKADDEKMVRSAMHIREHLDQDFGSYAEKLQVASVMLLSLISEVMAYERAVVSGPEPKKEQPRRRAVGDEVRFPQMTTVKEGEEPEEWTGRVSYVQVEAGEVVKYWVYRSDRGHEGEVWDVEPSEVIER